MRFSPPPNNGYQRSDPPVCASPEVEQAGHVQPARRGHGQVAVQAHQLLPVLDDRHPGVQDLLHVLAAGEEELDNVGDLVAVSPHLQPFSAVQGALSVEHQPGFALALLEKQ